MAERASNRAKAANVRFEPMTASAAAILGGALAKIDPWALYGYTPAALSAYLAAREADAPRFEIMVDRAIAGAIGIRRNWMRGPYLQFLGILPPYQRQGIGRVALAWFEGEARAQGAQNLWVAASDFNARALSFYEHHGFNRVATLDALIAEGRDEILLRKRLATP
jgi:GNAT superfamily N-acetyltransferase